MQAGDVSLGKIFANDHQNFIPLFQRPYVWDEVDNWQPLWEDIKTAVEEFEREQVAEADGRPSRTYFLGAIVSQARRQTPRRLSSSNVIDGQQRLTTLQTLLSAARRVASRLASPTTIGRFTSLLENRPETIHDAHPEDRYKVWPLPQDNEAFQWALRPVSEDAPPSRRDHKIVKASLWFESRVEKWARESPDPEVRMENLFTTLRDRMQLVHIVLDPNDDPQVIFEALNHRGVPLDAADLIKNLLFQTVDAQGDHKRANDLLMKGWLPLDDSPWRDEITTGRLRRSRIDILLSYWLTIQSRQEVIVDHLFADFKAWMSRSEAIAADVILNIRQYADTFWEIQHLSASDPATALLDRMAATTTTTPWPVILYLYGNAHVPPEQRNIAVRAIDSFLMRRGVCRLSTGDYNRLFLQVLTACMDCSPAEAGDAVERSLSGQTAESRRWPTDTEFSSALRNDPLYTSLNRPRLKALLVALENRLRTGKTEPGPLLFSAERKLTIEHLLPRAWEKHWPLPEDADESRMLLRTASVHRLGNLTLLTSKLNPSVSNREWEHKKSEIRRHSLLRLTTSTVLSAPSGVPGFDDASWTERWDEERIRVRGNILADLALTIWGAPREIQEDSHSAPGSDAPYISTSGRVEVPRPSEEEPAPITHEVRESDAAYEATDQEKGIPSTTQVVTQADLDAGQIRIPARSKHHFPPQRADLQVIVEDVELNATWDPRMGPDRERSGTLRIGKTNLQGLVFLGAPLLITKADGYLVLAADF